MQLSFPPFIPTFWIESFLNPNFVEYNHRSSPPALLSPPGSVEDLPSQTEAERDPGVQANGKFYRKGLYS